MNLAPNPALVTQGAAQRLPRLALLLFCAAYVLPGLFGRDPWRNADLAAFGQMLAIAEGRTDWLAPALGGLPTGGAPLPHALGGLFIWLGTPWLDAAFAARVPFALLLALTLVAVWYAAYHLARGDEAQPLPLAFGGEAAAVDYARAIADAALLAVIATLGLLQLGHETTPELAQLAAVAGLQWGWAVAPARPRLAAAAALLALPALAASGAPAMALLMGAAASLYFFRHRDARRLAGWTLAGTVLAAAVAGTVHTWLWRLGPDNDIWAPASIARLLLWFLWPAWPLALWTLWRWRRRLAARHLAVPLLSLGTALAACLAMGGHDRALMLGLPGIAVLAAFALPTLRRGAAAAIDWFSVCLFTGVAAFIWLMYIAMQTGVPAKPAANVLRLAPGFAPSFSLVGLAFAAAGTLAWLWLVRWRTKKHREALWKSLVLPAGGVALAWLLLMTLWLPLLDYARSYRPLMTRLTSVIPKGACVAAPGLPLAAVAALEHHGRWRVDRSADAVRSDCAVLVRIAPRRANPPALPGWQEAGRYRRPTDRDDVWIVYRRAEPAQPTRLAALSAVAR